MRAQGSFGQGRNYRISYCTKCIVFYIVLNGMRGDFVNEEGDEVDMAIFLQEIFCDNSKCGS